jgi:kynureninase
MPPIFSRIPGAQGWQQSNPSVLAAAALEGSLEPFRKAGGMHALRKKSTAMTTYLETRLKCSKYYLQHDSTASKGFKIITPGDAGSRGCQLSLLILGGIMTPLMQRLKAKGVICDERRPDVLRLAPTPLYNTFEDCRRAAGELEAILNSLYTE